MSSEKYKNKRRYLSQYLELKRKVEKQAEDMGYWQERARGLSSPDLSKFGIHSTSKFNPVDKFLELAERCAKEGEAMEKKKAEISRAIDNVEDPKCRMVLIEKYLRGRTLRQIAFDTHYSSNYIYHLHLKALQMFQIPKDSKQ